MLHLILKGLRYLFFFDVRALFSFTDLPPPSEIIRSFSSIVFFSRKCMSDIFFRNKFNTYNISHGVITNMLYCLSRNQTCCVSGPRFPRVWSNHLPKLLLACQKNNKIGFRCLLFGNILATFIT